MKNGPEYWYIRDGDDVAGPFSLTELDERRSRGELGWSQEVSQDRLIWVSASVPTDPFSDDSGPDSETFTLADLAHRGRKPREGPTVATGLVVAGLVLGLVVIVYAVGSGSGQDQGLGPDDVAEATPDDAEAILRVLRADAAAMKEAVESAKIKETPSLYSRAIAGYVSKMRAVDAHDCPARFRIAFKTHLDAWEDLGEAVGEMPDDFMQGLFVGALNKFLRNENDGGLIRMTDAVKTSSKAIRNSFREVERIAAAYGAAL